MLNILEHLRCTSALSFVNALEDIAVADAHCSVVLSVTVWRTLFAYFHVRFTVARSSNSLTHSEHCEASHVHIVLVLHHIMCAIRGRHECGDHGGLSAGHTSGKRAIASMYSELDWGVLIDIRFVISQTL